MKYWLRLTFIAMIALVCMGLILSPAGIQSAQAKEPKLLEWDTMVGVPRAYIAARNAPIRGVNGGGLPWVLTSGVGELSAGGKLEIKVKGLVFDPNDPDVIARGLAGRNTVAQFRAIVSCQSVDAAGNAAVVNVTSDPFAATVGLAVDGGGNAKIETRLALPQPCIAPVVFVTSPTGSWFAATGN